MTEFTKAEEPTSCEGPDYWPETKQKKPKPHKVKKKETIFWAKPPKKKLARPFCSDCALAIGLAEASEVLNAKLRDW